MHITLRAGERLFLNGAVIRADRKVSLELMNHAVFLLEAHVMQPEKATSPLRQLYFIVQTMLMSPADTANARALFDETLRRMLATYAEAPILAALHQIGPLVAAGRLFDSLKILRGVFVHDDELMKPAAQLALAS